MRGGREEEEEEALPLVLPPETEPAELELALLSTDEWRGRRCPSSRGVPSWLWAFLPHPYTEPSTVHEWRNIEVRLCELGS